MDYKNWYAIAVQTNKEKSIARELLVRKAIMKDTFLEDVIVLETKEMVVKKDGKRKVKKKLLMPGYILVKVKHQIIDTGDEVDLAVFPSDTFNLITKNPGVKSFVNCNKDKPLPMRPREAKNIFDLCDDSHLEIKQNIKFNFFEGDILDVVSGPFSGYKCEVISIQGTKILGQLDMFDRQVPVEFTKSQLYKK